MGLSKKKFRKNITVTNQEILGSMHQQEKKDQQLKEAELAKNSASLFVETTKVGSLKNKREKLKANRFKEHTDAHTSKTEEVLIKRIMKKMDNREAAGLEPNYKRQKTSPTRVNEDEEFGGEVLDIWATPSVVKSKKFH